MVQKIVINKNNIDKYLKYFSFFRQIFFFLTLLMIIFAFSVYQKNKKISQQIRQVSNEINLYQNKYWFNNLYYLNFLKNKQLATLYFHHQLWIPLEWEKIIEISYDFKIDKKVEKKKIKADLSQKWYLFLKQKVINKIKTDNY